MYNQLAKIAQLYGISEVYAFGSRSEEIAARVAGKTMGKTFPGSDVDIGIEPEAGKRLNAKERVLVAIEFEDLFQVSRVDLLIVSEAPPFLALEVLKGALLYVKDPDDQAEHELLILRRAGDLAYYEKKRREKILQGRL
jgi:predicted nucleotidyltransferase